MFHRDDVTFSSSGSSPSLRCGNTNDTKIGDVSVANAIAHNITIRLSTPKVLPLPSTSSSDNPAKIATNSEARNIIRTKMIAAFI